MEIILLIGVLLAQLVEQNEQGVCIQYFDKQPTLKDTTVCFQDNFNIDLSCMNNFSLNGKI